MASVQKSENFIFWKFSNLARIGSWWNLLKTLFFWKTTPTILKSVIRRSQGALIGLYILKNDWDRAYLMRKLCRNWKFFENFAKKVNFWTKLGISRPFFEIKSSIRAPWNRLIMLFKMVEVVLLKQSVFEKFHQLPIRARFENFQKIKFSLFRTLAYLKEVVFDSD